MKTLFIALLAALVLALPAQAGKATISVSPSVINAGDTFTVSGCGYNKLTTIQVWHNWTGPYVEVEPDGGGCVSATFSTFGINESGDYLAQISTARGNGGGWNLRAELAFTVG